MSDEKNAEKMLKERAGTTKLSTAIENLETKKERMEDEFKKEVHFFFENLNPIILLDRTLQNVRDSSTAEPTLFKKALAFGSGYSSKRNFMHVLKLAMLKVFSMGADRDSPDKKNDIDNSDNERDADTYLQTYKPGIEMMVQNQNENVKAKPEVLPEPTYWPFFLAMGLAFLGWGLLTTWLISLAGFIILVIALVGWINILRHE
ncbi:MAG: hypothetical protein ABJA32_00370 [Ginsengibacter sp.]